MKTKKIALFSCAALVAAGLGLNIQNALADYGINDESLSLVAVGPGSNSNSNSNSNSGPIKSIVVCLGIFGNCTTPSGATGKNPLGEAVLN